MAKQIFVENKNGGGREMSCIKPQQLAIVSRKAKLAIATCIVSCLGILLMATLLPMVVRSGVSDDEAGPQTIAVQMTSDKPLYFYSPSLPPSGGTVYFNSLSGKGAGQKLTVDAEIITSTSPISAFIGGPAFNHPEPVEDTQPPWSVTYSVGVNAGSQDGVRFTAVDSALLSDTAVITFTQDNQPPAVTVTRPKEMTDLSFAVSWSASDNGSGLEGTYDIQYKVNAEAWQDWIPSTTSLSAVFGPTCPLTVAYDHDYSFRVTTQDRVRNEGSGMASTSVKKPETRIYLPIILNNYRPVVNGGFEQGWRGWTHGGELHQSICSDADFVHSGSRSALLGDPNYECKKGVPVGSAWMSQTFVVPSHMESPQLSFYYRIFSEDKFVEDKFDSFDVYINETLILRTGDPGDEYGCDRPADDLGWQRFECNLAGHKGQSVTVKFCNVSRPDTWFNTWTYVDDIQLQDVRP